MSAQVVVHPTRELLAAGVAARLVTALLDALAARGRAHVVLTGGTVGTASLAAVREVPAHRAVDWSRVHLWWGDERFVPSGHEDRNETQARTALLDHLADLGLHAATVHPMAADDGPDGDDVDAAARRYAAELASAAEPGDDVPVFDVLMLGMGPDGHVASLFPGGPQALVADATTVAVRDSPKPPPTRISLTFPALQRARQVWLVADGEGKAGPLAAARAGAGVDEVPAAGATGETTLWLLDEGAAGDLDR